MRVLVLAFLLLASPAIALAQSATTIDLTAKLPALDQGHFIQECAEQGLVAQPGKPASCVKVQDETLQDALVGIILQASPPPTVPAALARDQFLHELYEKKTIPPLTDQQKHLIMSEILRTVTNPTALADIVHLIDPTQKPGDLQ
jgi:hypothetical protein